MINENNWDTLIAEFLSEYSSWVHFNTWMEKHYNAIEIIDRRYVIDKEDFRIYEFSNKEKYMEFALRWL